MNIQSYQRFLAVLVVGITSIVGSTTPASAAQKQDPNQPRREVKQNAKAQRVVVQNPKNQQQNQQQQEKVERPARVVQTPSQPRVVVQDPARKAQRQQQQQDAAQQRQQQIDRNRQVQVERDQYNQRQQQQQIDRQRQQPTDQRVQVRDPRQAPAARLPQAQQQQRIRDEQIRVARYNSHLAEQERLAQQRAQILRQQNRLARYRYQQQYYEALRQQQLRLAHLNSYNYYNDPFYYTAPSYRYSWGGRYYTTNQYGANLLRQAVNNGYEEGFEAGRADREDRWSFDYRNSFAYEDANFGYTGLYVDQSEYNYYFREGFRRGYEDAYYGRNQYGSYSNGRASILGAVLSTILNFSSL